MSDKKKMYDANIIAALKALPVPLKSSNGNDVLFDMNKRSESIFEHIAKKSHHIHVKDIACIPKILMTKESLRIDKKNHKFNTYIGKRGKKKERLRYLKIITIIKKDRKESIVTIYPVKTKGVNSQSKFRFKN